MLPFYKKYFLISLLLLQMKFLNNTTYKIKRMSYLYYKVKIKGKESEIKYV